MNRLAMAVVAVLALAALAWQYDEDGPSPAWEYELVRVSGDVLAPGAPDEAGRGVTSRAHAAVTPMLAEGWDLHEMESLPHAGVAGERSAHLILVFKRLEEGL